MTIVDCQPDCNRKLGFGESGVSVPWSWSVGLIQNQLIEMKSMRWPCFPKVLGIVVSVCMAHGWQLEAETGLQVCICVSFCACYCVLCASVWRKWLAVERRDWPSVFVFGFLFCQCLKDTVGNWKTSPVLRWEFLCLILFVCVCVWVWAFVPNTWLEARTRNGHLNQELSVSRCLSMMPNSVCIFNS